MLAALHRGYFVVQSRRNPAIFEDGSVVEIHGRHVDRGLHVVLVWDLQSVRQEVVRAMPRSQELLGDPAPAEKSPDALDSACSGSLIIYSYLLSRFDGSFGARSCIISI